MRNIVLSLLVALSSFAGAQTPTQSQVYNEIRRAGIKYPDIALAQAILESGHFKSKLAKHNNNLFGMRMPKKRETTAVGTRYGYARYLSWKDSVEDYKLWQDYLFKRHPNMTKSQFKRYIDRLYSTSSNYIGKINTIINKNSKYEEDHNDRDSVRYAYNDSVRSQPN
jgi:uncharacterized FlgJ-related protein